MVVMTGALLCGLSSAGAAQRGGRSRGGAGGAIGDPAPTLHASDVVRLAPIAMLLDRRGELALVDSQITRLSAIGAALRAQNAVGLKSLDSLLQDIRVHARDTTGTDGDRLMRQGDQQRAFAVLLGAIRDNDDAAAGRAMGLLSGRQLRQAFAVVQEQRSLMRAVVRGGTVPDLGTPSRGVY
ncbi:MAG TPA: hypothetical protein VIJ16_10190 [Gemmatimonadaceae bacterium]